MTTRAAPRVPRRWCLFTSAGDRNIVASWIDPAEPRAFDLVVAYYGDDEREYERLSALADVCVRIKGGKYQNAWRLWQSGELAVARYDYVWLADDDMGIDPQDIERSFRLAQAHRFWVSSPAHDPAGKVSNPFMVRDDGGHDIRIVTYVEVTWPIFRADKLEAFFKVFDGSLTCWGVDHWYAHVLGSERNHRFAIFDCIAARNMPDAEKGGQREIGRLVTDQALIDAYQQARARHDFAGVRPRTLARVALEWDVRRSVAGLPPRRREAFRAVRTPNLDEAAQGRAAEAFRRGLAALSPAEEEFVRDSTADAATVTLFGSLWLLSGILAGGVDRVLALDADASQAAFALLDPQVATARAEGRLVIGHVDVGALAPNGRPVEPAAMSRWRGYPEAPWSYWGGGASGTDVVVVAGMFRRACALRTYLHWQSLPSPGDRRLLLRVHGAPGADFAKDLARYFEPDGSAGYFMRLLPKPMRAGEDGSHASFQLQRWQLDVR